MKKYVVNNVCTILIILIIHAVLISLTYRVFSNYQFTWAYQISGIKPDWRTKTWLFAFYFECALLRNRFSKRRDIETFCHKGVLAVKVLAKKMGISTFTIAFRFLKLHLKQETICVYHFIFAKKNAKNRKYTAKRDMRKEEEEEKKGRKKWEKTWRKKVKIKVILYSKIIIMYNFIVVFICVMFIN